LSESIKPDVRIQLSQTPPRAQNEQSKTNCIKICIKKSGNLKTACLIALYKVENSSGGVYPNAYSMVSLIDPAQWAGYFVLPWQPMENTSPQDL
jgi:hypothetical protein